MAILAQTTEYARWVEAGWTPVRFPENPNEIVIGGGPLFLVNSSKDLIFIDHAGLAFEIEPFSKEFIKVSVRPAQESYVDAPLLNEEEKESRQIKFDF